MTHIDGDFQVITPAAMGTDYCVWATIYIGVHYPVP